LIIKKIFKKCITYLTARSVTLSYSQISLYNQCPLKYKYRYIEKRPLKPSPVLNFGSTIHNTLKDYHRNFDPQKAQLTDLMLLYQRNWIATAYKDPAEEERFRKEGTRLLEAYYEKAKVDPNRVLYLEEFFRLRVDECTLVGKIDRVDSLPDGGWEIIDYKTSRKVKSKRELENLLQFGGVPEILQLDIYYMACQEKWRRDPKQLSIYYLAAREDGKICPRKVSFSPGTERIERIKFLRRLVNDVARGIRRKDFRPKAGPLCNWCDYKALCPAFKEIPDAQARLRLSYSKIDTFRRCPAQYKSIYIDRLPTKPKSFFSFGSSIHATLEEFYDYDGILPTPPLRYLFKLYDKHWIPAGYRDAKEKDKYYQDGLKILEDYYQKFIKSGFRRAMYLEKYFELPIGKNAIMGGYMDRVDELSDGNHALVDYKTEPREPTQEALDNDLQFTIYYWAAPAALGFGFDKLYFDYLRFSKRWETKRTQADMESLIALVDQTAEDIRRATKANDFPKRINKYCASCDLECDLKKNAIEKYGSLEV
jgi:RecB family exonuclease